MPTFVITTITGIPSDFIKTPSGSGKTICSSAFIGLNGVVVDAIETDETEFGTRPLPTPFLIVADDADDVNVIVESLGSI